MRIVFVNSFSLVTGGADRHCFDLARILREAGHDVAFIATSAPCQVETEGEFIPASVTNATRDDTSAVQSALVAARAVWNPAAHAATLRLIRGFRPDVFACHKIYPHLSVAPIVAAQIHGVPIVQTLHDYEFLSANAFDASGGQIDRKESRARYRALNNVLFRIKRARHAPAVDEWIAVSRDTAETYRAHGIDAVVLPNFTLAGKTGVPAFGDRQGMLFAGRLTAEKGVEDVIAVARAFPDVMVRIAGHGRLRDTVQVASRKLENLTFLGSLSQDDVQDQLRSSRVCLMPSHWPEPGPLACLEAMAAGTPTVAYRSGGLAQYIEDAGAGMVVDEHIAAFIAAAGQLTTNNELWNRCSHEAICAVGTVHSPRAYLDGVLPIYTQAIENRRRCDRPTRRS